MNDYLELPSNDGSTIIVNVNKIHAIHFNKKDFVITVYVGSMSFNINFYNESEYEKCTNKIKNIFNATLI